MSRVSEAFKTRKALITYITAGDPNLAIAEELIYALEKSGADIVELGVPFSDPLADGPVIQASHLRALKKDVSLNRVFGLVKKVRNKTKIPIVFMLSYNLVLRYGEQRFYSDCEGSGVDGVIVPDLSPDEYVGPGPSGRKVDQIFLIAPTSTDKRIKLVADESSGFIYLVSLTGITGKRKDLSAHLDELVQKIKKYTDKPVAIGFGISSPEHARECAKISDGVIVGSAIVDLIAKNKRNPVPTISKFVSSLRRAIDKC